MVKPEYNLDVAGASKLEKALLEETPDDNNELVVDLSSCKFVASSGLRVLLKIAQKISREGGNLVVEGASPVVSEVLKVSGFDRVITVR